MYPFPPRMCAAMLTIGWLVRDTFRQSLASRIFWILSGVSVLCISVCATLAIQGHVPLARPGASADFLPRHAPEAQDSEKMKDSGVTVLRGELTLAFGAIRLPLARDAREAAHFLELVLAGGVADTMGLLLTLIWTAGFLPAFLDGRGISVLLAKPAPRWLLLVGKFTGVLAFVAFHAVVFVGGTWLAIGARTGIWEWAYWWSVPLLLLHFAIFFSFSLLLAVCTRSTVVSVFGSIVFWFLCWGMNFGRHALLAETYGQSDATFSESAVRLVETGYWILPKPADLGIVLYDSLGAADSFGQIAAFGIVRNHGDFHPLLSIVASLSFMAFLLVASSRQFATADY
ncbi:MAG TPA: ABC transporter permease subunit [Pirellulales bacterium]|nr:ABC transporter permease subunit [Pirellulales bacterium]